MAGSDFPSGGSGATSPPPTRPAKRKRGDSAEPPSKSSRATRSSVAAEKADVAAEKAEVAARKAEVAARKAAVGAVRMARGVAAGALWTENTERGRGRGFGDVERMRAVLLGVRLARFARVPDDDPNSPYPEEMRRINCKISYLSSYPEKRPRIDPVEYQASVPEWNDRPSEEEIYDYKATTLRKLGTIVCPLNMDISATDKREKTRKKRVDKCSCSHPGSEDCVRVHVKKARSWNKDQLGEEAFKNCGLDAMGEQVGASWTEVANKKLESVDKLVPQNKHQKFMKIALKEFSQKEKKDLAKYYYNVFLPRRLASFTRAERKEDEAVDTDDEKSSDDDDDNEHRPQKKSKSYGSSQG